MIIRLQDLPSGWKVLDQRRWRTGISNEPWALRARKLGGVTAWRSFAAPSKRQGLWVQATPFARDDDAAAALVVFLEHGMKNLRAQVVVTATRSGPELGIPASAAKTVEQLVKGPKGESSVRYVLWVRAAVLSALCGSGEDWSWQRLEELAQTQTRRIDTIVST